MKAYVVFSHSTNVLFIAYKVGLLMLKKGCSGSVGVCFTLKFDISEKFEWVCNRFR